VLVGDRRNVRTDRTHFDHPTSRAGVSIGIGSQRHRKRRLD
jgi:hypothetical protein